MAVVANSIGMKMPNNRMTPEVRELLWSDVQVLAQQRRWNPGAGNYFFALASGKQCATAAFLRAVPAEQPEISGGAVQHDPAAGLLRGLHNHVHAMSIGGVVAEVDDDFTANRMAFQAQQLAMPGRGFSLPPDNGEALVELGS